MNKKGFVNILVVIGILIIAGVAGYFIMNRQISLSTPVSSSTPIQISDVDKTCTTDVDCILISTKCHSCPDTPINRSKSKEYGDQLYSLCEGDMGQTLECAISTLKCTNSRCVKAELLPPKDAEAHIQCVAKGGEWYGDEGGRGKLTGCITATTDGGKLCHDSSECQSVCLADSTLSNTSEFKGRCYGKSDYRGCGIILREKPGIQCID